MVDPPEGATTPRMLHPAVRQKAWTSAVIDISAGAGDVLGPYSAAYDIAIEAVHVHYLAAGAGTAAELNVGTVADEDAIVDAHVVSNSAADGDVETATHADTLKQTAGLAGGNPVVPAATQTRVKTTQQGTNTALVQVQIVYSEMQPGM